MKDNSDFLSIAVSSFRQLARFILREGGAGNDLNQIVLDEERLHQKRSKKRRNGLR